MHGIDTLYREKLLLRMKNPNRYSPGALLAVRLKVLGGFAATFIVKTA